MAGEGSGSSYSIMALNPTEVLCFTVMSQIVQKWVQANLQLHAFKYGVMHHYDNFVALFNSFTGRPLAKCMATEARATMWKVFNGREAQERP